MMFNKRSHELNLVSMELQILIDNQKKAMISKVRKFAM